MGIAIGVEHVTDTELADDPNDMVGDTFNILKGFPKSLCGFSAIQTSDFPPFIALRTLGKDRQQ
jgi:hypothetical protein